MQAYIVKRVLLFIPTMIMVTILVFLVLRIVPGDPAIMILTGEGGEQGEIGYTEQELAELRHKLGTDRNIFIQYGDWVWNMLHLDFGDSYFYNSPVMDDLKNKIPITLELSVFAVLLASVFAVPMGVISAIKQDTLADYVCRILTISGIALPNFCVGVLIILALVTWFNWLPPLGYANLWESPWENLQQLFFPAIALGYALMAFMARITRSSMLEVFREDYIRTARSKGLAERVVIYRHALKNALLPVVTVSGYNFAVLIAGTVVIETIFLVPGVGRLLITSINKRDFPTIQAIVVIITVVVLVVNLAMDLLYAWLNPRIRYT